MFNRIVKSIIAAFYGQGVTLLFQFISVPLFISAWGMEYYGQWLAIFAIPMTLTILDFGFFNIIGNKISKNIIEYDYSKASNIINVVFRYIFFAFLMFSFFVLFVYLISDYKDKFSLFFILMLYSFLVLLTNFIVNVFRANLEFHVGSFLSNTSRLIESIIVLISLYFDANMFDVSVAYLSSRLVSVIGIWFYFNKKFTWYSFKIERNYTININDIKDSINYAFLPIAFMLNNQGAIFVINSIFGSVQVAVFVTIRTYFRLLNQGVSALTNATWQEINYLYNVQKWMDLNRLMNKVILIVFVFSILIGIGLFIFINPVLDFWTHKEIISSVNINLLILMSVMFFSFWQPFHIFLSAIGKHKTHAKIYFLLQVFVLSFSYFFLSKFIDFLFAVVTIELIMLISINIIYKKNQHVI
jgi:O-antigen/teichoic acid export membrane protein